MQEWYIVAYIICAIVTIGGKKHAINSVRDSIPKETLDEYAKFHDAQMPKGIYVAALIPILNVIFAMAAIMFQGNMQHSIYSSFRKHCEWNMLGKWD